MNTIWAISSGSYSDYRVLCVVDGTKADAEELAQRMRGMYPRIWTDSDVSVEALAFVRPDVKPVEILHMRLAAKATGVSLALSYWDEHEPAPAPAGGGDSAISERTTDLYPYLVVGVETGHDPHRTLHGAVADAEGRIDDCLDDTWSEEVDEILVARVTHRAVRNVMGRRADMAPEAWTELTGGRTDVDEWWSYSLEPVDQLDAGAPAALAETVEPTETNPCGAFIPERGSLFDTEAAS